jgi:hypothetical protein
MTAAAGGAGLTPRDVTVTNPASWAQLAKVLRTTGDGEGTRTVGDPTGKEATERWQRSMDTVR